MQTTIVKWGNSQGVRLPKMLLESVNLSDNDPVEIVAEGDKIIIQKSAGPQRRKTIQELFEGYEGGPFKTELVDLGGPVGNELW